MTMKFDNNARKDLENSFDFGWLDEPQEAVREMVVREIPAKFARGYIAKNHYSKTFPDSTMFCFAGYLGDKIAGIITYGMGTSVNQYTSVFADIQKGEYLELTRLWSADTMPRNTESKIISESMKQLPKKIKLIVTFADPSQGHIGYIYQATNALYIGKSMGGTMLITKEGIVKHQRLIGIYRMRQEKLKNKSSQEIIDYLGWKKIKSAPKHKYVYLRGKKKDIKKMKEDIKEKIKKYPKLQKRA